MTADERFDVIARIFMYLVIAVIIFGIILGLGSCLEEMGEKQGRKNARQEAYEARLPKNGDHVMLDGTNVAVVKRYVWSSKFEVRYPDGTMADVAESEMLDKELIGAK